jgi:hypothetical protein
MTTSATAYPRTRAHAEPRGITMSKVLLNRKTAVGAVVATALLAGGVAFAYPPGTRLTVSGQATPLPGGTQADVLVTVANADPTCAITVSVGGETLDLLAGTFTGHVTIPVESGRIRISARTVTCDDNEHAHSNFVILDAKAAGESSTVPVKTNFKVELTGLQPGTSVTSTATLQGSDPLVQLVESDGVDKRGEATTKFKFKQKGTWVITSETTPPGTVINSVTVQVV